MREERDSDRISVDLQQWVKDIVQYVIQQHSLECPLQGRVSKLETRWYVVFGLIAGAGGFGGLIGSAIGAMIGG